MVFIYFKYFYFREKNTRFNFWKRISTDIDLPMSDKRQIVVEHLMHEAAGDVQRSEEHEKRCRLFARRIW